MVQKPGDALEIRSEGDIVNVRKTIREATTAMGFGLTDITRIVTAASELARNIFHYAGTGTAYWFILEENGQRGIELIFEDHGPGIPDVEKAMEPGYSTGGGLGLGLTGSKKLMDELEIRSEIGKGTVVIVKKWLKK